MIEAEIDDSAEEKESDTRNQLAAWAPTVKDAEEAVRAIIHHTASSLRTIFMVELGIIPPPYPFSESFPQLVDASMNACYLGFGSNQPYPKLKRIHSLSTIRGSLSNEIVDFLQLAPVLEQLRLTGIGGSDRWLPPALSQESSTLLFPNTFKRVILQQCAPPYGATCGNAFMSHDSFSRSLRQAALEVINSPPGRGAEYELVILEPFSLELWLKGGASGLGYHFEDARRDWIDLINGSGRSCWDVTNAIIISENSAAEDSDLDG